MVDGESGARTRGTDRPRCEAVALGEGTLKCARLRLATSLRPVQRSQLRWLGLTQQRLVY